MGGWTYNKCNECTFSKLKFLLSDEEINVSDYSKCNTEQLLNAAKGKIYWTREYLKDVLPGDWLKNFQDELSKINKRVQLFIDWIWQGTREIYNQLFSQYPD
jgi:hypothetical protein